MTTETIQTDNQGREQFESWFLQNNPSWEITPQEKRTGTYIFERANIQWKAWQAVLQSPEIQALRKGAGRMRCDTLLSVLGKLNSNPYNLTKSECIDVVREMFEEADAAMEQQR